jgi:hypothetical protein
MAKKFFVNVSPKAYEGIRKVYETAGAEVHAKVESGGNLTVVAILPDDVKPRKRRFFRSAEGESQASAR